MIWLKFIVFLILIRVVQQWSDWRITICNTSIERLLKKSDWRTRNKKILTPAENGFDDLINSMTKKFRALEIDENECSTEYLIEIFIKNPSMIKLPIIIDEKKIVIWFKEREIRCFLSKEYRRIHLLYNGGYFLED